MPCARSGNRVRRYWCPRWWRGIGVANHEAIAAAKAGIEGLTTLGGGHLCNVTDSGQRGLPGILDTPAVARIIGNETGRTAAAKQYPLPGIGDPADLARLMAWLLSEQAGWITGQVWAMDGGFSSVRPLVRWPRPRSPAVCHRRYHGIVF